MTDARTEILGRVKTANEMAKPTVAQVPREYNFDVQASEHERITLLTERLLDYKAEVRLAHDDSIKDEVAAALAGIGAKIVGIPEGIANSELSTHWMGAYRGEVITDDPAYSARDLAELDAIVTGATVASAQTGTIMLDAGKNQGRRALTLVPDAHICVLLANQIVVGMPAALSRLERTQPITMIAGPSATSDIELQRVEGVHGPRTLIVIIVAND